MTRKSIVIDTNVLVVSNGRNTHADLECQLACSARLTVAIEKEIILIDDQDLIFSEYQTYLNFSGEPGLGDEFFVYLFNHQYSGKVVRRVAVELSDDCTKGFEELPANTLKSGDRAVLAVAVAGGAPILNATDSDWSEQSDLLEVLGVEVEQLCPQHSTRN